MALTSPNSPGPGSRFSSLQRNPARFLIVLIILSGGATYGYFNRAVISKFLGVADSGEPPELQALPGQLELQPAEQRLASQKQSPLKALEVTLRRGDTLLKLLLRHGLETASANHLIDTMRPYLNPRKLRAGESVQLLVDGDQKAIQGIEYISGDVEVRVNSTDQGWAAERKSIPYIEVPRLVRGDVDTSLYESGVGAGLSATQIMELATLFEYHIDFFSDFQRGDDFSVLFDQTRYADGRSETGKILAAELQAAGEPYRIFRFAGKDGKGDYYDGEGKTLARAFLRAPLSYQRISSRYSLTRRHPIFRTVRPHRAIDYAAPAGTPVVAIGSGRVTFAGWRGGYGKLVEISHANGFATRYAHFSRIAPNIHSGTQVKQGQVVGYVGQTGHATGPHLHFEMLRKGVKINFLALRVPAAVQLKGADLKQFLKQRDRQLAVLEGKSALVAQAPAAKLSQASLN